MEEFEQITRQIFFYIGEYGISKKQLNHQNPELNTPEDKAEFKKFVHQGYRLGQELMVREMVKLLQEREQLHKELAVLRNSKNKAALGHARIRSDINDFRIQVLRHFADHIAWLLFRNNYYIARRFHSGKFERPSILHSNLKSHLEIIDRLHAEDDMHFALLTDLTSFIDIGDILLIKENEYVVIECKEGAVQKKVFAFIDEMGKETFDPSTIDFSTINKKFLDQVERTLNQFDRGIKLGHFLKTEEGVDPFKSVPIKVFDSKVVNHYYFDELEELIEDSIETDSSYGSIENIIFVGVYRNTKLPQSELVFREMIKTFNGNFFIVDYAHLIYQPLKEPFLFKPFGIDIIFELLFGRLKIYLAIDLDRFIKLFNSSGLKASWLSRKETHKYLEQATYDKPFTHKHRGIEIVGNVRKIILGDSFIIYLLFDNIKPSSLIERYRVVVNSHHEM